VKRFSFLLLCASLLFLVSLNVFGQTLTVHDGTSATVDVDWWTDTDFFYANWASANWSSAPPTDNKWYYVELQRLIGSTWTIDQWRQIPDPETISVPETEVTFSDANLILGDKYRVQVFARHEPASGGGYTEIGQGASDGAVIGSAPTASLSLTAIPSTLTFSSSETSLSLDLRITAAGTGSIDVTSIQEDRDYTAWGTETFPSEPLSLSIAGGTTATLSRTVPLTSLQRSKALGTSTVGGFSLDYTVRGVNTVGVPVERPYPR